jgi:phosphoesterase family protein
MKAITRIGILGLAAVATLAAVLLATRDHAEVAERNISPKLLASRPCGTSPTPPQTFEHVIWLWMENKTYSEVIGKGDARYTTFLAAQCGTATSYAIVGSPSLPNYIGATAGDTFGISDDSPPAAHVLTADNLFRQVRTAAKTARSYQESMPSNCRLADSGRYAVKHNPEAYFAGDGDRAACLADNLPLGTPSRGNLHDDLTNNTLATFSFITPNLCNDTHDCSVRTGDAWLSEWLPVILESQAYISGGTVIFLVYDEYTPIPVVVISPYTLPGTVTAAPFDHYSLLRTTEEMLGLTPFLGKAATAPSMRPAFNLGRP